VPDPRPVIDTAYISGDIGYRYHTGGHTDTPDWPSFVDFAEIYAKAASCALSGSVAAKSENQNNGQWTVTIRNLGPGKAYAIQIDGVFLFQTSGAVCRPMLSNNLPIKLGDIVWPGSADADISISFRGCPADARFTVFVVYRANIGLGGATWGILGSDEIR
jgi:hypothetical protein